jgi:tight adherence protein C
MMFFSFLRRLGLHFLESFVLGLSETGIAVLGGIAVFVTLVAIGQAFVPHDPMAARLRSHQRRRERLRAELLRGKRPTGSRLPRAPMGLLRQGLDRLKLLRGEDARRSSELLARAGWRSRDALTLFMAVRVGLPLAAAAAAFLVLLAKPTMPLGFRMLWICAAAVAGAYAPIIGLRQIISRRQDHLRKQLPDVLDLLVICAEAGLSLDAALTRVARELGPSAPHLADEFGLTAVELGFLPDRRQALLNLAKRTDLASIRSVVNTLVQTERYGTPLAHALRVLAAEFRDERMMKAEEKAARLPATLTVPMIVFILPTLFIVLMGPAIIQVLPVIASISH